MSADMFETPRKNSLPAVVLDLPVSSSLCESGSTANTRACVYLVHPVSDSMLTAFNPKLLSEHLDGFDKTMTQPPSNLSTDQSS